MLRRAAIFTFKLVVCAFALALIGLAIVELYS